MAFWTAEKKGGLTAGTLDEQLAAATVASKVEHLAEYWVDWKADCSVAWWAAQKDATMAANSVGQRAVK
jgi:hypothetical protein